MKEIKKFNIIDQSLDMEKIIRSSSNYDEQSY